MNCPHGINLKHRNCDRCEEVAYVERRDSRPLRGPKPDRAACDNVGDKALSKISFEELKTLKPGDRVRVRDDQGNEADYEVKMEPWELYHHEWVIGLKGISGGYKLSRVTKILQRGNEVLCVLCRRPNPTPHRSACESCVPMDEDAIVANAEAAQLAKEVAAAHSRINRWRDEIRLARDMIQIGNVIAGLRRLEMLLGER